MPTELRPPEGLLARIMRRLGLEKQLVLLRRHLSVIVAFLMGTLGGGILVVIGIREALTHSGFGPYLSLVKSDLGFVASHRAMYASALFGAAPVALFATLLVALTVLLICVRLSVVYGERLLAVGKSIKQS